jgi:hypothetical protein
MKLYQSIQELLVGGGGTQSDRQTGYLISLLSFLESRLKGDSGSDNTKRKRLTDMKITDVDEAVYEWYMQWLLVFSLDIIKWQYSRPFTQQNLF